MAAEQHGNSVEIEQLAAQPIVSIRAVTTIARLGEAQDDRLKALSAFLQHHGLRPAGPPFVRYHTFGNGETDLETGVPLAEPAAGEGRITAGELPGGTAVTTWHYGSHDTLGDAYARIEAWLNEHGRERDGVSWEVYYWIDVEHYAETSEWPDPSTWRAQLVQPIQ